MSRPRLSVVIPTCHRNGALALCLDRLAPGVQTLDASQYEVIVSDDGSRSTAETLVHGKYLWAHWTAGPRRGPASNRNHGANQAQGEWLVFTDDDCLPEPEWLEAYAQAIVPDVNVYEGRTASTTPYQGPLVIAPINPQGGWLWSCNMMLRASLFAQVGGFDEGFPHAADEDIDLQQRLGQAGQRALFVPDALVQHPPVRRPWGRRSARLWESKVRLGYKQDAGRAPFTRREMVWGALRTRARQLLAAPLSRDSFAAAAGLPIELLWISRHAPRWDRKHRRDLGVPGKYLHP